MAGAVRAHRSGVGVRIIAGSLKGRRLKAPSWDGLRPTSDKLRETLFNILAPRIEGARVLDGFAGTGAIGIEALSRGAKLAIFIEKDRDAVEVIKANLASLEIKSRGRIIRGAASLHLANVEGDLVFLDPPYPKETEYQTALDAVSAKPPVLTIVQHSVRYAIPGEYESLVRTRTLRQGDNALSFFRAQTLS